MRAGPRPRLRRALTATLALAASAALATTSGVPAAPGAPLRDPRLRSVRTFALAIGDGYLGSPLLARLSRYDLVVVDGEAVARRQVRALRRRGALVLGYLDVGTIEPGRAWFAAARSYRLDRWVDWGEWYADVAAPGYRSLLARRVAPAMLAKGLDGLFVDNVDMIATHRRLTAGMRWLVGALARLVHRTGGVLFAQNGEDVLGPIVAELDGWNREDVSFTYDFARRRYAAVSAAEGVAARRALRRMRARGLLVTATDYAPAGDRADERSARRIACAAGAVPFVGDIDLTRVGDPVPCGR